MPKQAGLCKSMNSKFIPNSFQVPNILIDEMMADLKDVELRCYLALIRKTTGWQKEFDCISNSQFQKLTGRGKTAITQALKNLQRLGLISEIETQGGKTNCYALNADRFANWTGSKSEPVQKVNGGGSESERVPVQNLNTQKTNTKPTIQKTTTTDAGAFSDFADYAEFALRLDWQPADLAVVRERLRGNGVVDGSDLWTDALADFAEYWAARPQRTQTAAAWDAQFIQSARKFALHNRQHYAADGSRAVSGSLPNTQTVSKTAQKAAWLRDAARARLDGKTAGKLKPAVFAAVCEGLAGALETGATQGAPLLEGLPALLANWEMAFAVTLGQDVDGSRVEAAFAALLGRGEQFPTVPMVGEKLPPLLPQFRQPDTPRDFSKRVAADEGARAEARARIDKLLGGKRL